MLLVGCVCVVMLSRSYWVAPLGLCAQACRPGQGVALLPKPPLGVTLGTGALPQAGGQAQFSTQLQAQFSEVLAIQRVQAWCLENLDDELSVPAMAKLVGMSERNF